MKKIEFKKLFSQSWDIYKKNWKNFILIAIVLILLSFLGDSHGFGMNYNKSEMIIPILSITSLIGWLASTYVGVGVIRYMLKLVDKKETKLRDIFYGIESIEHFVYVVLVGIIVALATGLGFILLIIPGIIVGIGLMFAKYYIAENRGEVFDAIKYSWKITKSYKWRLFLLIIVIALFNILGAVALLVGLIITIPVSVLVLMFTYRLLDEERIPEKEEQVVADIIIEEEIIILKDN